MSNNIALLIVYIELGGCEITIFYFTMPITPDSGALIFLMSAPTP